ncbi:MAG: hypothetical protein AAGA73_17185 [Pseudomonadota bacterium]
MIYMTQIKGSLAAILMIGGVAGSAIADHPGFTLQSIKGSWGFSGDGILAAANPDDRLPIAGIGVVTFDGEGGCEIVGINNLNGMALEATSEFCSYTVNPDGTGKSEATFPASGPLPAIEIPVSFVIVDEGQELRLMQDAVVVSSFVAKPIGDGRRRHRSRR